MQVRISSRHGHLSEESQQQIREKVRKLTRFFDRLTSIEVTADLQNPESVQVEVRVTVEHHQDFVAANEGSRVMGALDRTMHKLEAQIKKHKEKLTGHRATSVKHMEPSPLEAEIDEPDDS